MNGGQIGCIGSAAGFVGSGLVQSSTCLFHTFVGSIIRFDLLGCEKTRIDGDRAAWTIVEVGRRRTFVSEGPSISLRHWPHQLPKLPFATSRPSALTALPFRLAFFVHPACRPCIAFTQHGPDSSSRKQVCETPLLLSRFR